MGPFVSKPTAEDHRQRAIALGLISGMFDSISVYEPVPVIIEIPVIAENLISGINNLPISEQKKDGQIYAKVNTFYRRKSFLKVPYFPKRFPPRNRYY